MASFFKGQIDFIYLLYGLAFLITWAVCVSLGRYREYRLPWTWLGAFALMHGISKWLELFAIDIADNNVFSVFRLGWLLLSYLFLFEFSRRGLSDFRVKVFNFWVYLPVLFLMALSGVFGLNTFNTGLHCFLGLISGLCASWLIYKAYKSKFPGCRWLLILSISLSAYLILNAVIVPKVSLISENWVNSDNFFKVFGFPIQLLRSIFALFIAISLWGYSQSSQTFDSLYPKVPLRRQLSSWLAVTLLVIIGFGWGLTDYLGKYARVKLIKDSRTSTNDLLRFLTGTLIKVEEAVMTISGSPWISPALITGSDEDLEKAKSVLYRYNHTLRMSGCFLLNREGKIIATSNRNKVDDLIGRSYAATSYFKRAFSGWPGYYFAIDSFSHERCYYASFPVKDEQQNITGVVVIKKSIDNLEGSFKQFPYAFLIDPNGIIFLSSQQNFLFNSFWPVKTQTQLDLLSSGQFAVTSFKSLMYREIKDGDETSYNGEDLYVVRQFIGRERCSIVMLNSTKIVFQYRLFGIVIILFLCILVLLFLIAVRQREDMLVLVSGANTQLRTVLNAATHISIIATELHGLITVFNPGAERMLGFSADEMVEMHTPDILHLESELLLRAEELDREFGRMLNGFDVLVEAARRGKYEEREWTYVCKDGSRKTVNLSVTAQRDRSGLITGFLFVAMDITERKLAEYELQDQKEFSENLVQNAAVAIFVLDAQHKVIFWNKSSELLTGINASEMIGIDCAWKAFYKDKRPVLADMVINGMPESVINYYGVHSKINLTSQGLSSEGWYQNLGGKDRYIVFEAAPIYNSKGQIVAAIETLQDITERKRAEEALARQTQELVRSNTELERFAYVASHDLQEPLRMVSSYVQLIEKRYKGKLDSDADDFLGYVIDGVNWMQSLINALLIYSRVGTQAKEFQLTDCNNVVARALFNLQVAIEEHRAKVTFDPLPTVSADSSQLEQLFQNLISNAIKFHGEKSPRVHISVKESNGNWIFSIEDNGIGIDPQFNERIFEIFQRLHSRKEYPGTGIGLAICKKIIERHAGNIWVESSTDKGSVFYFTIPKREFT